MSWGRWCDRAPFHRKFLVLSNDAVALAFRANLWSRSAEAGARPGFLTRKELWALRGDIKTSRRFNQVMDELIDAGRPAHDHGILVPVEDGYEIHDFEDYGPPSATENELSQASQSTGTARTNTQPKLDQRRAAGLASARARRERNGSAQPPRRSSEPERESRTGSNDSRTDVSNDFERNPEREIPLPHTPSPIPDPIPDPNESSNSGTFEISRGDASASNDRLERTSNEPEREPSLVERAGLWKRSPARGAEAAPHPETWPEFLHLEAVRAESFGVPRRDLRTGDMRVRRLLERCAEGYSVEQLEKAIRGAARDDYYRSNPQMQGLDVIVGDAARVDRLISLADAPAGSRPIQRRGPGPVQNTGTDPFARHREGQ